MGKVLLTRLEIAALDRLVNRGLVQVSGITPSDASHVLGRLDSWDRAAAEKALTLFARRRVGGGDMLAPDAQSLAQGIIDQLTEQTTLALLEAIIAEEVEFAGFSAAQLARHILMDKGLSGHRGLLALDAAVNVDVVGLGASASSYYPAVGERLNCRMILPQHAGVANAIGAVVGRVTVRRSGTVTSPAEGKYRVHLESGPEDFAEPEDALIMLERVLSTEVRSAAENAGAQDVHVRFERDTRTAEVEGKVVFVESYLTAEASGRPRVAAG